MAGLVPAIHDLLIDRLVEIIPVGVCFVNQAHFPGARPVLQIFSRWIAPTIVSWYSHQTSLVPFGLLVRM
jgi:hypothetical protein